MALRESWCRGACSSRIGIAAGARSGGAACHAEQNRGTEQEEAKLGGGPPHPVVLHNGLILGLACDSAQCFDSAGDTRVRSCLVESRDHKLCVERSTRFDGTMASFMD
jgi:hypothetical protein